MAMSREEMETMLAIEEAQTGEMAGAGDPGAMMSARPSSEQIQVLQDIARQINEGTLPPGSLTGQPSNTMDGDVVAFQSILGGLPPEIVDVVLGTGGAVSGREMQMMGQGAVGGMVGEMSDPLPMMSPGVEPQNFGALRGVDTAVVAGTGGATTSPIDYSGASSVPGATAGTTGMPPTAEEAALLKKLVEDVRARGSERR
jgi:hypothetical protein|tara:strand:- start:232 stop:831 length:600 start_codon:yes stop_codon:yes gene_type:complete